MGDQLEKTLVDGEQEREQLHEKVRKMPHIHVFLQKNLIGSMTMIFQSVTRCTVWRDEESDHVRHL